MCCDEGPTVPQQLSWHLTSPVDIELNWLPPIKPNGVLVSYVLSFRDETVASTGGEWMTQTENGNFKYLLCKSPLKIHA